MKTDELQAAAEAILEHGEVNIPEAVMKSIAMEPSNFIYGENEIVLATCPRCSTALLKCYYCGKCGQKIAWPPPVNDTDRGDPCP